ncbi:MAG: hypothetical protein GY874_07420, partial [Desulfobacteraceae bacterium]|nr:hypothetical protein [Desulfobacteraceae bacterium]
EKRHAKEQAERQEIYDHVDISYRYADEMPVAGAQFKVHDQSDKVVAKGKIGSETYTRQEVPKSTANVTIELFGDPKIVEYTIQPKPNPELDKEQPGWLKRMWPVT